MNNFWFCFTFLLVMQIMGCKKETEKISIDKPLTSGSIAKVNLNFGEEQIIPVDAGIAHVSFTNAREGRCPTEDCSRCLGGYATVSIRVKINNGTTQDLQFESVSCQFKSAQQLDRPIAEPQQAQGYTIDLIDLTEYSRVRPVPKEQYTIRLFIKKQ